MLTVDMILIFEWYNVDPAEVEINILAVILQNV